MPQYKTPSGSAGAGRKPRTANPPRQGGTKQAKTTATHPHQTAYAQKISAAGDRRTPAGAQGAKSSERSDLD